MADQGITAHIDWDRKITVSLTDRLDRYVLCHDDGILCGCTAPTEALAVRDDHVAIFTPTYQGEITRG